MAVARTSLCLVLLVCANLVTFTLPAAAQKYPERNVRLIVAFPTGASQILGLRRTEGVGLAIFSKTPSTKELPTRPLLFLAWMR